MIATKAEANSNHGEQVATQVNQTSTTKHQPQASKIDDNSALRYQIQKGAREPAITSKLRIRRRRGIPSNTLAASESREPVQGHACVLQG
jgi:hypothetical protein